MSFSETVSRYHEAYATAVAPRRGSLMTKAEIDAAVADVIADPKVLQWLFPSDHCSNHSNDGACECAQTDHAIFHRIGRGTYRVL